MPIYQYKCSNCDHQLEALQKMSDPRLLDCPQCEQATLVKQVTAAAFKLNGTGWYETDFKNSGKKPSNDSSSKEAKPSKAEGSGSDGSKSDAKKPSSASKNSATSQAAAD